MISETIRRAMEWAIGIANDPAHGYSQARRWGPDYDCSSFVISAYEHAGLPLKSLGASTTFDMVGAFVRAGFSAIPYSTSVRLQEGDVLVHRHHHTVLYLGNNKIVHASIDENGGISGPKSGDQTAREICVRDFYIPKYGWEYVLRLSGVVSTTKGGLVMISVTQCKKGSKVPEVAAIQTLLNALGYKGADGKVLEVDSSFGGNTDFAVRAFQKNCGISADGVVGPTTWQRLLQAKYAR